MQANVLNNVRSNSGLLANDVAHFFISKEVSPLKLQKLLYYSQLWYFVKNDNVLFQDKIEAWIYGPVVHSVWSNYKYYRRDDIIRNHLDYTSFLSNDVINHLEEVWSAYGHLNASELVDLSHNEWPWINARKGLLINESTQKEVVIDNSTTFNFTLNSDGSIPYVSKPSAINGVITNDFRLKAW